MMGEGADTIGIFPTIAFAEVSAGPLLLLPLAVVGWLGARSSSMTHQLPMKPRLRLLPALFPFRSWVLLHQCAPPA